MAMINVLKIHRFRQAVGTSYAQAKVTTDPLDRANLGTYALCLYVLTGIIGMVLLPGLATFVLHAMITMPASTNGLLKTLGLLVTVAPAAMGYGFALLAVGNLFNEGGLVFAFNPLSTENYNLLIEMLGWVEGGDAYLQKMTLQRRSAYGFDFALIGNASYGALEQKRAADLTVENERHRQASDRIRFAL